MRCLEEVSLIHVNEGAELTSLLYVGGNDEPLQVLFVAFTLASVRRVITLHLLGLNFT